MIQRLFLGQSLHHLRYLVLSLLLYDKACSFSHFHFPLADLNHFHANQREIDSGCGNLVISTHLGSHIVTRIITRDVTSNADPQLDVGGYSYN